MTVVAYDGEIMAADTQALFSNENLRADCKKIFKRKGYTFGISGDKPPGNHQLLEWFFGERKPYTDAEFTLLVITPAGKIEEWDEGGRCEKIADEHWAIGGGSEAAMVGMDAGLSAREVVALCIKRCGSCGGKVFWKRVI